MTNHLEIKKYYHGSFQKTPDSPSTFFFMPNRSSGQVLESSGGIEKLAELSRNDVLDLYLAYDMIVVT